MPLLVPINIDIERNKRVDRKLQLAEYDATDTRKYYRNVQNKARYQKRLLQSLQTETGFDTICISCLQYKSRHICKIVTEFDLAKYRKYFIKDCALLKNRLSEKYVCNLCFNHYKFGYKL